MKKIVKSIKEAYLTREDLIKMMKAPLVDLLSMADEMRRHIGDKVELCSILSAKTGSCSEDCRFCAQSCHWSTDCPTTDLVTEEEALQAAVMAEEKGIDRFSLVTSGRSLEDFEIDHLCSIYEKISKETDLKLCSSHGLLRKEQLLRLAQSGVSRYHCNLEAGSSFFKTICTTHTSEEKKSTLRSAKEVGLELCSGGILGLGEGESDRLDLIMELQELKVHSVPLNILSPIAGTPLEDNRIPSNEEILRWGAICRLALPHSVIRYAGGRKIMGEDFKRGLRGGINGLLSGDYLTTTGRDTLEDIEVIASLGLKRGIIER